MLHPLRLAYGLATVIAVLEARGRAVEPLLAAADIPRFALEEPSYRIRFEQELRFIRLALNALKLPSAGIVIGREFHLALFGVLGLAASCAPTARDMYRTIHIHSTLAWGCIEHTFWRDGDDEFLSFDENDAVGDLGTFFIERDAAAVLTLLRQTVGPEVSPQAVRFRHLPPPDAGEYDAFFGCRVAFGAARNELRLRRTVWDTPPPQANPMSYRFFDNQCRRLTAVMDEPLSYADVVRSRLRDATPMPSLPTVVATLHLTTRTLQRRLDEEGTSFSALLAEVRRERALELMRRSGMDNAAIAWTLGFEDASAFSRAFKSWTGLSPRQHRDRLRDDSTLP